MKLMHALALCALVATPAFGEEVVVAKKVAAPPLVDGAVDTLWADVKPTLVTLARVPGGIVDKNKELQKGKYAKNWTKDEGGTVTQVELKAVYTDTDIYFLATWKDATKNDTYKIYHWDKEKKEYLEGKEKEDRITLQFPISGDWNSCMLGGTSYVTDIWNWKAARTNPAGLAHDKYHVYSTTEPKGKFASHYAADGKTVYVMRPNDGNVEPYKEKNIDPFTFQGDDVPRYEPIVPSNTDAADVKAKGVWADGAWAVEMGRKLNTGNKESDAVLDPAKGATFTVAIHENSGDHFHTTSGTVRLEFAK